MDTIPVNPFPRLDALQAELRATSFERLPLEEAARIADRFAVAHHSNAMEDIHPSPELSALFALFVEERVPLPLARACFMRFMRGDTFAEPLRQHA